MLPAPGAAGRGPGPAALWLPFCFAHLQARPRDAPTWCMEHQSHRWSTDRPAGERHHRATHPPQPGAHISLGFPLESDARSLPWKCRGLRQPGQADAACRHRAEVLCPPCHPGGQHVALGSMAPRPLPVKPMVAAWGHEDISVGGKGCSPPRPAACPGCLPHSQPALPRLRLRRNIPLSPAYSFFPFFPPLGCPGPSPCSTAAGEVSPAAGGCGIDSPRSGCGTLLLDPVSWGGPCALAARLCRGQLGLKVPGKDGGVRAKGGRGFPPALCFGPCCHVLPSSTPDHMVATTR